MELGKTGFLFSIFYRKLQNKGIHNTWGAENEQQCHDDLVHHCIRLCRTKYTRNQSHKIKGNITQETKTSLKTLSFTFAAKILHKSFIKESISFTRNRQINISNHLTMFRRDQIISGLANINVLLVKINLTVLWKYNSFFSTLEKSVLCILQILVQCYSWNSLFHTTSCITQNPKPVALRLHQKFPYLHQVSWKLCAKLVFRLLPESLSKLKTLQMENYSDQPSINILLKKPSAF